MVDSIDPLWVYWTAATKAVAKDKKMVVEMGKRMVVMRVELKEHREAGQLDLLKVERKVA